MTCLVDDWCVNAQNKSKIMNKMNPEFWKVNEVNAMWNEHLNLTLEETLQYSKGQYAESIATFDEIEDQGVSMGDMFSNGIMGQFPEKFSGICCVPMNEMS